MIRSSRLGLGLALLGLLLTIPYGLDALGQWVRLQESLDRVDALLLLPGDRNTAPQAVARFYHQGLTHRVLLIARQPTRLERLGLRPPRHERQRQALLALGVSASDIDVLGPPVSHDPASGSVLARWAKAQLQPQRVLAVTAEPWGRLWRHDLRQGLGPTSLELALWSAPSSRFGPHWWRSRHGLMAYFDAFVLGLRRL